jgi:SAM-dependent methyltransferase
MKLSTVRRIVTHKGAVIGSCPVCGSPTVFVQLDANVREGLQCLRCRASSRHRHVAYLLAELLGVKKLRAARRRGLERDVYIAEDAGPTPDALVGAPRVTLSGFHPGVEPGAPLSRGATCQNLERLTYDDASFDVVVTEDVLEHVRRPQQAFDETRRVLRPDGVHLFTVPYTPDRKTLIRVDTTGEGDVLLMAPEWHGDAIRGRILAYRTFGYDLLDDLTERGWDTTVQLPGFADRRRGIFESLVLVSRRRGSGAAEQ